MTNVEKIRINQDELVALAQAFGGKNLRLFGSTARGESRSGSDIDLLIDMDPGRSLLDLIEFSLRAEDLLRCKVDVVTPSGISPYIREQILGEAIVL